MDIDQKVESDEKIDHYQQNIWDKAMSKWTKNGCPENDLNVPRPGKHPKIDHLWNIDPEAYMKYEIQGDKNDDQY